MIKRIVRLFAVLCCLGFFVAGHLTGQSPRISWAEADQRAEKILSQMTLEEKIDYIGGVDGLYIRAIPRLGVPDLKMSDGPLGVRSYGLSTGYPGGINMAATWDTELEHEVGIEMGRDARARGVHFLLGPGMNIYRAPMCGRNFEYFGEDPFLASRMAVAVITGIQSQGVIATAKHFMGNNQEWDRHNVSSDIDERTMREIYLPSFEAAVKEGHVGAIMDSYNLVNGTHMTQNPHLMEEIAKKEWGFKGIIMSDWDATYDGVAAANAGLDLEMPSAKFMNRDALLPAIQSGTVSQATIDEKVRRILRTAIEFGFFDRPQYDPDDSTFNQEGRSVALKAALGGMVLLKNNGVLPFDKFKLRTIAVIGPRAFPNIPEGGGSAHVATIVTQSFLEGISNYLAGTGTKIAYSPGIPDPSDVFNQTVFTTKPEGREVGLAGEYFDNAHLEGSPARIRTDASINFAGDWWETPGAARAAGHSVRWTGYYTPKTTGEHTFYARGRDGFRLYVDGSLVMDHWEWGGGELQLKSVQLEAGRHYKLRLEYFRNGGRIMIGFGIATSDNAELTRAKEMASKADAVVLCVGFDVSTEGEGSDRSFALGGGQNDLIKAVLGANKNVVIVLTAGGNVDMSGWIESAQALLDAWYPGEEGGTALARILFGDVSPSGKLPASFERRWEDNATYNNYYDTNGGKHVAYAEGVFLGYRHFDKAGIKPLFPFGYGLSYTTFKFTNLKVTPRIFQGDEPVKVSFEVTNTGQREGAEVAEVYVSDTHAKIARPIKELKGFAKVDLKPGETRSIEITLNRRAFSYFDAGKMQWTADAGDFGILVGNSSAHIELEEKVALSE
jgi:beta-glucosidase